MKLPAKIEYAFKAIIELSLRYQPGVPVQLNVIAKSQGIPDKFLIQLLLRLKNANIISTSRGISGGYYLARSPALITLLDVFKALGSEVLDKPKGKKSPGKLNTAALLTGIWAEISDNIIESLAKKNFEDLVKQLKNEQPTYYI